MNMAECGSRPSEQPQNVNFGPSIGGPEVEFVNAVTAGGSVKFLLAV